MKQVKDVFKDSERIAATGDKDKAQAQYYLAVRSLNNINRTAEAALKLAELTADATRKGDRQARANYTHRYRNAKLWARRSRQATDMMSAIEVRLR